MFTGVVGRKARGTGSVSHWAIILLLGSALAAGCSRHPKQVAGKASVVDGDTLEIVGHRVRLEGIDAPEASQLCNIDGKRWRCGQQAALALDDWIDGRIVVCDVSGVDRYRRLLGRCVVGAADVQQWMVNQGFALAYRRYSKRYVSAEDSARAARRGMWAGQFDAPWDWRRMQRRDQHRKLTQ